MLNKEQEIYLESRFKELRTASVFLFPVVAFLAFRAQDIIPFLSGERFNQIIFPFQIIIWSAVFIYFNYLFLGIARIINKVEAVLLSFGILVVYAVVLNLCLIPRYWLAGVGVATLASSAVMFIFIVASLNQAGVKIPLYKSLEKPVIATMGMTVVLHYVDSWALPIVFLLSAAVYSITLAITIALDK